MTTAEAPTYKPAGLWTPAELDALTGSALPRIGTPRTAAATRGPVLSALDEIGGFELAPWQRYAADCALEVAPGSGHWLHRVICVVVARQNGKTSLAARRILAGLFVFGDGLILHTAADRALPRETFEELATMIDGSRDLRRYVKSIRWANGQEAITLKDGSRYRVIAPRQSAARGYPRVGLVLIDEAREHTDDALMSAIQYTQRTHPNPQLWMVSNAGDPDSLILNRARDRGHAAADDPEADPGICYLEWSAPPEAEPDDPLAWVPANPNLGVTIRGTTLLEELRTDDHNRFRTEALCQWVDTTTRNAIPWGEWVACADADLPAIEPGGRVWAAVDIDPEHVAGALMLGAWLDDGTAVVGVHTYFEPASEAAMADAVVAMADEWGPISIAYDPQTCLGIIERTGGKDLRRWERISGEKWVAACAALRDLTKDGALRHGDQANLNGDIAAAGRRDLGDGLWRMSRLDSERPIPAAVALARLAYVMLNDPGPPEIFAI